MPRTEEKHRMVSSLPCLKHIMKLPGNRKDEKQKHMRVRKYAASVNLVHEGTQLEDPLPNEEL